MLPSNIQANGFSIKFNLLNEINGNTELNVVAIGVKRQFRLLGLTWTVEIEFDNFVYLGY